MFNLKRCYQVLLGTALLAAPFCSFASDSDPVESAVNHPERFEADRASDPGRKPSKLLKFSRIKAGDTVLDLFSGTGYYTELISFLVGDEGKVISHNNNAYIQFLGDDANRRYQDNRLSNVDRLITEANQLSLAENSIDVALLALTFHDFYYVSKSWKKIDADDALARIKHSLKPGGLVVIVDHAARSNAGTESAGTLHRISPKIVKEKMEAAGFTLIDEADFLKNPKDSMKLPMGDPRIRGKTNRFVLLYRK